MPFRIVSPLPRMGRGAGGEGFRHSQTRRQAARPSLVTAAHSYLCLDVGQDILKVQAQRFEGWASLKGSGQDLADRRLVGD